jgi:putative acetyltransferase
MTTMSFSLRPIRPDDDAAVAAIIRTVMPEFGAGGPGFAIHDAEVGHMSRAYAIPGAAYYVVVRNDVIEGGGGVAALAGGDPDVCELRKMYFLPSLRGLGAGRALILNCLNAARAFGYRRCYLETLAGMDGAQRLYESAGFQRIAAPMGGTGHYSCDRYYIRDL